MPPRVMTLLLLSALRSSSVREQAMAKPHTGLLAFMGWLEENLAVPMTREIFWKKRNGCGFRQRPGSSVASIPWL